jgi:hypothetical protein
MVDAGHTGKNVPPKFLDANADRRDRADPRNYNPSFCDYFHRVPHCFLIASGQPK